MAMRDPLIGTVLSGRYRIDSVIARGGMAMVYRGTDLRLSRAIAIKVMHAHLAADDAFVERFEREAMNAAQLNHPNLVSIHDQGRDGDIVFLVMEYLESVTLRKELKHRGKLTPRQAIVVADAVLAALEVVHDAGMIHRDLKPDNVLLGTDGQIKLTDFGLARPVSTATTTKTLIGTVGYVAPELVTRAGADARTDLYTIGIMLYEMLTGSQPYTDEVPIQVAYRHVHDRVPAPSEAQPGIANVIDALVLWATSPDPGDRPASAADFRMALAEARAELSDEQLDLGGAASQPAADQPVLTATADIDAQIKQAQSDSVPLPEKRATDEIPYLAEDEDPESDSDSDNAAGGAGAASVALVGASAGKSAGSEDTAAELPAAERAAAGTSAGETDAVRAQHAPTNARKRVLTGLLAAVVVMVLVIGGIVMVNQQQSSQPRAVPAVAAGVAVADAEQSLTSAGFTSAVIEEFSAEVPAGRVLKTQPEAGVELQPGETVTLVVSKGRDLVTVPTTVGLTEKQAKDVLKAAGLRAGQVTTEYSDTVADGQVISQHVEAESEVDRNSPVNLVVSKGPEPITIPDVTGISFDAAYGRLLGLGFRVGKDEVFSDNVPKGDIVSQHPRAGSQRAADSLVLLRVSKGKEPKKDEDKKDSKDAEDKTDE